MSESLKTNKKISRSDLIQDTVNNIDLNLPQEDVKKIVVEFLNNFYKHLSRGDSVSLMYDKIGRFDIVKTAPRKGRNLQTGQIVNIPSRFQVKFLASNSLKNLKLKKV